MLFLRRHNALITRLACAPHLYSRSVSNAPYPAATRTATAAFFQHHGHMPHAIVPKTSIAVSRVGFGAYRVNRSTEEHRMAILEAVRSGVNVIDTSAHFENETRRA
ncbi:hypothetical protein BC937DRAFT_92279 [Endogone sp. FLAS-F59071]|nr:hypothetical protein BC937DRAFT_92279 [Endogone sp. FLAS-F59071]|eukprot:RUS15573.1 hypothetical protein BC937DRAFT_92279 [Endogone sp. FLAS-F59071]